MNKFEKMYRIANYCIAALLLVSAVMRLFDGNRLGVEVVIANFINVMLLLTTSYMRSTINCMGRRIEMLEKIVYGE